MHVLPPARLPYMPISLHPHVGHKKLIKFQAIDTYKNVLQYPENTKGNWNAFFKNDHPLTLELACGKGEYSVNLLAGSIKTLRIL